MKIIKKVLLFILVLTEVVYLLQPISIIAKENIAEQYNNKGKDTSEQLTAVDVIDTDNPVTEPVVILPETSRQSSLLADFLDGDTDDKKKETVTVEENDTKAKNSLFSKNKSKDKSYKMNSNTFSSILPTQLNTDSPITLQYDKTTIQYLPMFYSFDNALVNDNTVVYYSNARNTIFSYYADAVTFKEEITLLAPQEEYKFHYDISIDKGRLIEEDGQFFIVGQSNEKLLELSAPVAIDANGNTLNNLGVSVIKTDNTYQLELIIDPTWMNADERVYPVIIDPQFKDVSNEEDTTISEASPTTNNVYAYQLAIGNDGSGKNRAFFKINEELLQELIAETATLNTAYLSLYAPDDTQLQSQTIQLCSLTEELDLSTATWTNANAIGSTCQTATPVIDESLKYLTNLFPLLTALPTEFEVSYEVTSGTPTTPINQANLYYLFDGDTATSVSSVNGDNLVNQEITIDLNQFIRPEEIMINFGGDADSSGENISIEFINTNTNESFSELISNGMSAIDENSDYEVNLTFVPTITLYNQVKLKISSTQENGTPRINEFQVTRYQLEEHYIQVDLSSYLQDMITNNSENYGFYLRLADETQPVINIVSNDASEHKPEFLVDYDSTYDVSPRFELNDITLNLHPNVTYSGTTATYNGVTFDGTATPGSVVNLYFKEYGTAEYIVDGEAISNITTSYINSNSANYLSAHNFTSTALKQNGVYQVEVEATKDSITSTRSIETFMIAYVSYYNNLADIAFFYGVDAETLRQDNNITGALDNNSVIFIRNPKRNLGIPYDTASVDYITDTKTSDYLLGLNDFNEYYQNRVNVNTGNYHLAQTDMTFMMFDDEVNITRVYNSKNSLGVRQFGQNWIIISISF